MPTPYANTVVHLRKTDLPEIREAVVLAVAGQLHIDPRQLVFEPTPKVLRKDNHRLTLRGDKLNRTAGYFELTDEWTGPGGKRQALWRVAQSPSADSAVEVQFTGSAPGNPAREERGNWAVARDLFARWQEKFPFLDTRDYPMPINEKITTPSQAERLLERLMNPERRHAVVLVSQFSESIQYPISHHQLNAWLAGYAPVVRVESSVAYTLTDRLGGSAYGCFNGSLRILQPNYNSRKRSVFNPIYLSTLIQQLLQDGSLENRLFYDLMVRGQQAMRFRKPQATYERVNELLRQQYSLFDRHEGGPDLSKLELRVSLKDAQLVNDQLREQIDALEKQVAELRTDQQPERLPLAERLRRRFADNELIEVWKTAYDAAEPIGPDQYVARTIDRAFEALEAYAAALADNEQFILGSDIYHFFKNRGVYYHYTDSPSTMGIHGDKRRFTQEGRTREVTSHFTLNSNTDRCVQLYFESDPDDRVLRLVYAGRHLPTAEGQHNN